MNLDPDVSMARFRRHAWWATAIFSLLGFIYGFRFFLGVLSGGLLAIANLDILARLVKKLTAERPGRVSWLGLFGVLFRYILLSIALFVIISVWHANVVGLALGFSVPVAAVFVECGMYARRAYRESKSERKEGQ
ncbi:MAG: ATP synthase subunit I [Acidobacteria bacterium]|nr:MAG: ATP synthase subunit I [Acidobacteriota bacterium]